MRVRGIAQSRRSRVHISNPPAGDAITPPQSPVATITYVHSNTFLVSLNVNSGSYPATTMFYNIDGETGIGDELVWTAVDWVQPQIEPVTINDPVRLTDDVEHSVIFRYEYEDYFTDPEAEDPFILYTEPSTPVLGTPTFKGSGLPRHQGHNWNFTTMTFNGYAETPDDPITDIEYRVNFGSWMSATTWVTTDGVPDTSLLVVIPGFTQGSINNTVEIRYTNGSGTFTMAGVLYVNAPTTPGPITDLAVTVNDDSTISVSFTHAFTGWVGIGNYRQEYNGGGNHGYQGPTNPLVSPLIYPYHVGVDPDPDEWSIALVQGENTIALASINLAGYVGPYTDPVTFVIP